MRVVDVNAYYDADEAQRRWLVSEGETASSIGQHAGIKDTSELMAVNPQGVDLSRYASLGLRTENSGVSGNPMRASAERGRALLALKTDAAVAQIERVLNEGSENAGH